MSHKINITVDDLKKIVYFTLAKVEFNPYHHQGTVAKSDYIGGYIDRWVNKLSEHVIFNKFLLAEKEYKAINDYVAHKNTFDVSQSRRQEFLDEFQKIWEME